MENKVDCNGLVDDYSPLVRASINVSNHVLNKQPGNLREDLELIVTVTNNIVKDYLPVVSTNILKMIKNEATDLIGMIDSHSERGTPMPYDSIENMGVHFEMLALEAMILDTARCACKEGNDA